MATTKIQQQLELFPEGTDFSLNPPSKHLYDGLRLHFGMSYSDRLFEVFRFVDGFTTLILGHPVIDVVRLDR